MKLSKQTSDAIHILTHCYRAGDKLIKVASIAESLGLTKQMALKLANVLSQAGFVETTRGPNGGICLSDRARTASLGDIVRALESQPSSKSSSRDKLQFDRYIDEAFAAFLKVLDRHPLAEMAAKKGSRKASAKKRPAKTTTRSPRRTGAKRDRRTART